MEILLESLKPFYAIGLFLIVIFVIGMISLMVIIHRWILRDKPPKSNANQGTPSNKIVAPGVYVKQLPQSQQPVYFAPKEKKRVEYSPPARASPRPAAYRAPTPAPVRTTARTSPEGYSKAPKRAAIRSQGQSLPSDRRFPNYMLAEGRKLASNLCEHTDTRTGDRCRNRWQEGDHFYDYGKGGATTNKNLVGACKWHNDPRNPTLKRKDAEVERLKIESRRKSYFPPNKDVSVGAWRNTGLRLTFSIADRVYRFNSVETSEIVSDVKEAILANAGPQASVKKLHSVATFGELFDYLWHSRSLQVENLEGIDPLTGHWASLRTPSEWAKTKSDELR